MSYFKKRKRIKYNWIHIINEMGLSSAFDEFVHKRDFESNLYHKKTISLNRHARAFVLHYRRLLPADLSWALKGKEAAAPTIESFK